MKKLTSIALTTTICAVVGFANIGIADSSKSLESSENMDKTAIETPLKEHQTGEEAYSESMENNQPKAIENVKTHSEFVMGTVTLVGDNMIKVLDSETATTRAIKVSQKQKEELSSGYIIDAEVRDGRLVAFTKVGVPENVEDIVYTSENLPKEGIKIQMPPTWGPQS